MNRKTGFKLRVKKYSLLLKRFKIASNKKSSLVNFEQKAQCVKFFPGIFLYFLSLTLSLSLCDSLSLRLSQSLFYLPSLSVSPFSLSFYVRPELTKSHLTPFLTGDSGGKVAQQAELRA